MSRELREPLDTVAFNQLDLRVVEKRLRQPWWNLRWATYATSDRLFFASHSGRLTPSSGQIPCLYLARNRETAFHEIYGDDLDAAEKHGLPFYLTKSDLQNRLLLKTSEAVTVRLYDLSAEKGAKRIGLDLGTLYDASVDFSREFAQRLHDHPLKFDGILYLSRQTQSLCIVLWATHSPALKEIELVLGSNLWDLAEFGSKLPVGTLRLFDHVISVAGF